MRVFAFVPDTDKHASHDKRSSDAKCETLFILNDFFYCFLQYLSYIIFYSTPLFVFSQVLPFEYPPQNIPQQIPNVRTRKKKDIYNPDMK